MNPLKLFLCVAGSLLLLPSWAEGHRIKWDAVDLTTPTDEENRLVLFGRSQPEKGLVDATTDPPNPFSETEFAWHVKSNSWARFHLRSLIKESHLQGALLVDLVLVENAVSLLIGANQASWQPGLREAFDVSRPYLGVSLRTGENISVRGIKFRTASTDQLESGVPYTVVVKWNFHLPKPHFSFYLNGEPLLDNQGKAFVLPIDNADMEVGVNVMRISLGNAESPKGEMLLGRIMFFEDAGDFWAPELPKEP